MTLKGLALLKQLEGFRNHPYLDSVGVPTIGYGNTRYDTGEKVKMTDRPITIREATELLETIVATFEADAKKRIKVDLDSNQMDALIMFAYNVGSQAFADSTLLKVVNNDPNDFEGIKRQFLRWVYAGGKESKGLRKRRNREFYYYQNNKL